MPKKKKSQKKNSKPANSGLGRALINSRVSRSVGEGTPHGRQKRRNKPIQPIDPTGAAGQFRSHTQRSNVTTSRGLKSATQVTSLTEFMDRVEEKHLIAQAQSDVITIIEQSGDLAENEHRLHQQLHRSELFDYYKLPIPRRPIWDEATTPEELDEAEEAMFLNWRRTLSLTAQKHKINAMTPFERNLEVWRQLWRVIERSDTVVIIVDARNPLAFLPKDLLDYVSEVGEKQGKLKSSLVLVNKSDFLTRYQRRAWRDHFEEIGIDVVFFSALYEQLQQDILSKSHREKLSEVELVQIMSNMNRSEDAEAEMGQSSQELSNDDESIRVLGISELFAKFQSLRKDDSTKFTVGFVGYPNVGKSSLINALVGAKKVGVAGTPGKTKHFQTIEIESENMTLCDCPGLVFPTMLTSKADLVLNGVLPIDNLTDFMAPLRLAVHRLPLSSFNKMYGLDLNVYRDEYILRQSQLDSPDEALLDDALAQAQLEEYMSNLVTVFDVVDQFCDRRGLKLKAGSLDRSKGARVMLKDFVRGKLLYCHPPPHLDLFGRYAFIAQQIYQTRQLVVPESLLADIPEESENPETEQNSVSEDMGNVYEPQQDSANSSDFFSDLPFMADGDLNGNEFEDGLHHPLDSAMYNPSGKMGSSKRKDRKKKRAFTRAKRKQAKNSRAFRHDANNFVNGSNAVVSSSVPGVKATNSSKLV